MPMGIEASKGWSPKLDSKMQDKFNAEMWGERNIFCQVLGAKVIGRGLQRKTKRRSRVESICRPGFMIV